MAAKRAARAFGGTVKRGDQVNMDTKTKVSKYALKILSKMAAGTPGVLTEQGGMRVASLSVPENLTRELLAKDLIIRRPIGNEARSVYRISSAGEGFLRRASVKRSKAKAPSVGAAGEVDGYLKQHQVNRMHRIKGNKTKSHVEVNLAESPLGWLYRRRRPDGSRLLEEAHLRAADRLRADFEAANLGARVTSVYDGIPVSKKRGHISDTPLSIRVLAARDRYNRAMTEMGPGLADIVSRVCCSLEGLEQAERGMNWPARAGKIVLRIGLDRLIEHYQGLDYSD